MLIRILSSPSSNIFVKQTNVGTETAVTVCCRRAAVRSLVTKLDRHRLHDLDEHRKPPFVTCHQLPLYEVPFTSHELRYAAGDPTDSAKIYQTVRGCGWGRERYPVFMFSIGFIWLAGPEYSRSGGRICRQRELSTTRSQSSAFTYYSYYYVI